MKTLAKTVSAAIALLLLVGITGTAAAETVGGDQGWYVVHANVDGADVYFDGDYKGQIANGELNVPVYTTGTPYQSYSVSKAGYTTYTAEISQYPAKGETVDLYATLNPAEPTPGQIGGDQGWYVVHANVDGAQVYFDNELKGTISDGTLSVPVYTTGTPYQTFTVSKAGYTTYTAQVDQFPGKGETVDLYATLNPATPVPTQQSPISPITVLIGLLGAGMLLALRRS
ncbi:PEGA domain-containing protein [Methanoculleus sp. FWC-SCC1]|uniref:PEGA domain-containing protein n=1 Tax=Methanoculleus frigidifontis TaxID=2584085 RepID=A0ABT8M9H9_9EURY|nr:PEGA domain-containing protein [Methanoculleus sp. FWC-SCC1]MDN7024575.1 PEGA domain-containing protein [Methanoculleus sp. FWC-SCC1]